MKSIFRLGMKVRYFSVCAKVELYFVYLKSRKNYSNLSFYLKWTSLGITSTSRLPWDILRHGVQICFSVVVSIDAGIGVWRCDGCWQEAWTPIPEGLETEDHVSSPSMRVVSPLSRLTKDGLGCLVSVGALKLNLSALYSQLSNFDKTCHFLW